ncbi:MarR family winged helix-turn-helix transcriptional regulator [Microbacterium soli]|uniref:MarR family transcriptional regulator n=1 Tax=Microbacterium soli TaxID=446075 RepID=A0ABP7N7Z6_9MICO
MTDSLTTEELRLWRDFLQWTEQTMTAVGADLASNSSMSVSDFEVAVRVQEAGGVVLQRVLGEHLGWSASRLSHQLRRMEKRGLLTRPKSGHGRSMQVVLTASGRAELDSALAVHARSVREHFLSTLGSSTADIIPRATSPVRCPKRIQTARARG